MANLPERICVWDMDKDDPTSSRGWSVSFPEDHPAIYVRADHYAALEAQLAERVKVKPLEWTDVRSPDGEIRYHHIIADSSIGQWSIQWKGWKDYDDRTVFLDGDFVLNGGDLLEAAKAAAQADFERRILSALEATPPAPKVADAVAGAVRVCPVRDAVCPHGMDCLYNDGMDCDMEASRADLAYQKEAASLTAAALSTPPASKVTDADMDDAAVAALVALASHNIPTDIQELLVRGDPMRSIPPGALSKSFAAALQTLTAAQEVGK